MAELMIVKMYNIIVLCKLHFVQCSLYTVQYTVCTVHVYSVYYTVCCVLCTVYMAKYTDYWTINTK